MRKEHTKKMSKAAAIIAALSLAASGAVNVAYAQKAHAEGDVNEPVNAALASAEQAAARQIQESGDMSAFGESETGNHTTLGTPTIKVSNTGSLALGADNHIVPGNKESGVITFTMEQAVNGKEGNGIQSGLTMYMTAPTFKNKDEYGADADILKYLPAGYSGKTCDRVRVYECKNGSEILLNADDSEANVEIGVRNDGTLAVSFTDEYVEGALQNLYGKSGAKLVVEADVVIPDDVDINILNSPQYNNGSLGPYEVMGQGDTPGQGQAEIPIDVRCMSTHNNAQDPAQNPTEYLKVYPAGAAIPVAGDTPIEDDSNWLKLTATALDVSLPNFTTNVNVTKEAQVYGTVDYKVSITNNTKDTTASQIQYIDSEIDKYLTIGCGIVMSDGDDAITITKYNNASDKTGVTFPLTKGVDWSYSNTSAVAADYGTLYVHPRTLKLAGGERIEIHYQVYAGVDSMKNNKTDLGRLFGMDEGNLSGERSVDVACQNMFKSQIVRGYTTGLHFNLLHPSITPKTPEGAVPAKIDAGNTSSLVTVDFELGSSSTSLSTNDEAARIQSPTIGVFAVQVGDKPYMLADAIKEGIITDVKVDDKPYTFNTPIVSGKDKKAGEKYRLTYRVHAPSEYVSGLNTSGIKVHTYMNGDNVNTNPEAPGSYHIAEVEVSTPSLTAVIDTNSTPSAASAKTVEGSLQTVGVTFGSLDSAATGVQFVITDEPKTKGQDPVAEGGRFQNVTMAGRELKGTEYTVSGNTLTINCNEIPANGSVEVFYYDKLASGWQKNGYEDTITALAQRNPSADSNLPADSKSDPDTASFTIQTPVLAAKTVALISPEESDEPGDGITEKTNVVNIGDVVDMETTFNELNTAQPKALGRDFELTIAADKLIVKTNGMYRDETAAQLGIAFCDVDKIKLYDNKKDVTSNYNVDLDATKTLITITGKDGFTNAPEQVITVKYTMTCGKNTATNYDQLAGEEITTTTTFKVSNLENPLTFTSAPVLVANAELSITKEAEKNEISFGDSNTYTIIARNDVDNKYSSSSMARGVIIEDVLSAAAQKFGYRIDTKTIKVTLDGTDITDKVTIIPVGPADKATEFDLKFTNSLLKKSTLMVTYDATTALVAQNAYDNTLRNAVIATADNSRPAIASASVDYKGKVMEKPTLEEGGTIPSTGADDNNGTNATSGNNNSGTTAADGSTYTNADGNAPGQGVASDGKGTVSSAGDIILYVLCGVVGIAIIGGIIYLIVRKRNS